MTAWGPRDRPNWKSKPIPKLLGGAHWAAPEFDSDDMGTEQLAAVEKQLDAGALSGGDSEVGKANVGIKEHVAEGNSVQRAKLLNRICKGMSLPTHPLWLYWS